VSDKIHAVVDKISEYGIVIFRDYPVVEENTNQHVFISEDMVLFLDHNDGTLSVSFHASSRPEEVSRNTLILNEIEEFDELYIMESYVIDNQNEFLCGDEAFNLIKQSEEAKILKGFIEKRHYEDILRTAKCFYC
jgi:hypothetical protein